MNITATKNTVPAQTASRKTGYTTIVRSVIALSILVLLSACVTDRTASAPSPMASTQVEEQEASTQSLSTGALDLAIPADSESPTQNTDPQSQLKPKDPKDFALDLINLMGTSPGKCGAAADNTPQVNWTCAEYTSGLGTFITNWDKHIESPEVFLNHSYIATSGWMYFAIDGEIDFFWKTYDLESTQVLVAYDPSEKGNELIIGLNPVIGNQIAAANGSQSFINESPPLSNQE